MGIEEIRLLLNDNNENSANTTQVSLVNHHFSMNREAVCVTPIQILSPHKSIMFNSHSSTPILGMGGEGSTEARVRGVEHHSEARHSKEFQGGGSEKESINGQPREGLVEVNGRTIDWGDVLELVEKMQLRLVPNEQGRKGDIRSNTVKKKGGNRESQNLTLLITKSQRKRGTNVGK